MQDIAIFNTFRVDVQDLMGDSMGDGDEGTTFDTPPVSTVTSSQGFGGI